MNLGSLANFIGGKIGMSDATTLAKLKGFAAERYSAMYAGALWKDALTILTKAVTATQSTVILPAHLAQFVEAKTDRLGLLPVDQAFLFRSNPELWDAAGTPTMCSELAPIATKVMPSSIGEQIRLYSDNAGDVGKVTVYGEDGNGDQQREQVQLAGLAHIATANSYAVIYGLSKATTAGKITAETVLGSVLLTLLATDTQRLHRRVRLHAIPSTDTTLVLLVKRHPGPFTNDEDATNLPPLCDQALQAMVHGDALEWMRQYGKAQSKYAEGLALLEAAKKVETYQSAQTQVLTPDTSVAEGCSPNDFL